MYPPTWPASVVRIPDGSPALSHIPVYPGFLRVSPHVTSIVYPRWVPPGPNPAQRVIEFGSLLSHSAGSGTCRLAGRRLHVNRRSGHLLRPRQQEQRTAARRGRKPSQHEASAPHWPSPSLISAGTLSYGYLPSPSPSPGAPLSSSMPLPLPLSCCTLV